jgi:DNA polymerase III subunit delta'
MFFSDIIGQDKVKQRLISSVKEERISHAQLFAGPEGSGKLGLAVAYAQYISCRDRKENESCGVCPSCRKYSKLIHPDLHFAFPVFKPKGSKKDAYCDDFLAPWREILLKSHYFSLNQWINHINAENAQVTIYGHESEAILRKLNLKSSEAEFKVMIIWLPEKMNITCANKLLKMIEEPPSKTLFLLVTEDEGNIISTICSRTQIIRIPGIADSDLRKELEKDDKLDAGTIAEMIHCASGNYLKAIEYKNMSEEKSFYLETFQKIMRHAYLGNITDLLNDAEELASLGRERQKDFILYALRLIREFFILNLGKPSLVFLTKTEKEWGLKFSPYINERNVIPVNQVFEEGYRHIVMNGNARIVFSDIHLKIAGLIKR